MEIPHMDSSPKRGWRRSMVLRYIVVIGLLAIIALLAWTLPIHKMKSSFVYQQAMMRVNNNHAVDSLIGRPVESDFVVSGSVSESGPTGAAAITVPIHGPNGAGTLSIDAEKVVGVWIFNRLVVDVAQKNQQIDLLKKEMP